MYEYLEYIVVGVAVIVAGWYAARDLYRQTTKGGCGDCHNASRSDKVTTVTQIKPFNGERK